jgi:hypothetical protein
MLGSSQLSSGRGRELKGDTDMSGRESRLGWRSANDGKFISEKDAKARPKETVVHERIPLPGKGTSK